MSDVSADGQTDASPGETTWFSIAASLGLLAGLLISMDLILGRRVSLFSSGFAVLWFSISFVLLSRPPAIPEFRQDGRSIDEHVIVRRDVIPVVPIRQRFYLSLVVACGACLLLWLTFGGLGR